MARLIIDSVSDFFKSKLKRLATTRKTTYRKIVLDAIEKIEGLKDKE